MSLLRKRRDHRDAADYLLAHRRLDRRAARQEDVHPRTELHDAEAISGADHVALFRPADDAPSEYPDDLSDDDRLAVMVDDHFGVFVQIARIGPVRGQKPA